MNITRDQIAEMIYESAMYKLHQIEQINLIRELWDKIEINKPVKKIHSKKVKLDYKR